MSLYECYKPLRNNLRQFNLIGALEDLWRYSLHLMDGYALPSNYAVRDNGLPFRPVNTHIHPWDLDLLSKEILLHATDANTRSLKRWSHLATVVNYSRSLDDKAFVLGGSDAIFEVHRLAHRQFPWQTGLGIPPFMRALKVFGAPTVNQLVTKELGMTIQQLLQLGSAVAGHFISKVGLSINTDYSAALGIPLDVSTAFLKRITATTAELRTKALACQSYDENWLYTWNPLEATPLVSFDPAFPERVLCPIPRYMTRRVTIGVFYDLVGLEGFNNPFGNAFQAYIGDVIGATCPAPRFAALSEEPYYVGREKKHGVDWVLSDNTGHLFIECKTKRLTLNAKIRRDSEELNKDINVMAKAIVQHYRNIQDALDGKTQWIPDGRPIYPLVLTLEDWFIFSPSVRDALTERIRQLFTESGMEEQMLEAYPFTIASSQEFEIVSQIIARLGVSTVMSKTNSPERQGWSMLPIANTDFPDEMREIRWNLFPDDWDRMMANISDSAG